MNRSVLIALGICAALAVYMLTGLASCGADKAAPVPAAVANPDQPVMTVKVRELEAAEIARIVVVAGKTAPSRAVDLKAETIGKIVRVVEKRGQVVEEGQPVAEIEMKERASRLAQARALLDQAALEHEAALRLQEDGMRSQGQVAEALARLRGAEQAVRFIELDIRNTVITAPFDGVLQERMVEVGDYLGIGDPVARVIDLDPLIVTGQVTEFDISHVRIGEHGRAVLGDGRTVDGIIRYVAGEADARARTFTVELEVANPGSAIPAGLSANIEIETERVAAYRISPALISIADDGRFGVKIVDEQDRVQFVEADIVKTEPDALWLSSLPARIRLITVGQGFTQPGDKVAVALEDKAWN